MARRALVAVIIIIIINECHSDAISLNETAGPVLVNVVIVVVVVVRRHASARTVQFSGPA